MTRYGVKEWDAAVRALREARRVGIGTHVNPDGDALGSLLGSSLGLRKLGKETWASWPETTLAMPPGYDFLPGQDALVPPDRVPQVDLFLALDCGGGDRLVELEDVARSAPVSINVDHHPGNDMFGSLNVVVDTASSTAELVTALLQDVGVEMDPDIATCLYTGIVTDTGNFQYANAGPDTLRLAADLLEYNVQKTRISQSVYETAPFGFLQLAGRVLGRAKLFEAERFIYSSVTREDLEATGVLMEETDPLIDLLRSTRDAEVSAIFKQKDDGSFRVSMRSKNVSVGEIARAHGGGGHDLAAGFTTDDVDSAVHEIVRHLRGGD